MFSVSNYIISAHSLKTLIVTTHNYTHTNNNPTPSDYIYQAAKNINYIHNSEHNNKHELPDRRQAHKEQEMS